MRTIQQLLDEYLKVIELDCALNTNVTTKGFIESLSPEEKDLMKSWIQDGINKIRDAWEMLCNVFGENVMNSFVEGLERNRSDNDRQ